MDGFPNKDSSKIIDDLRGHCKILPYSSLCYYFFDGSDQETTSLEIIFRALILQLFHQCKDDLDTMDYRNIRRDFGDWQAASAGGRGKYDFLQAYLQRFLSYLLNKPSISLILTTASSSVGHFPPSAQAAYLSYISPAFLALTGNSSC